MTVDCVEGSEINRNIKREPEKTEKRGEKKIEGEKVLIGLGSNRIRSR